MLDRISLGIEVVVVIDGCATIHSVETFVIRFSGISDVIKESTERNHWRYKE